MPAPTAAWERAGGRLPGTWYRQHANLTRLARTSGRRPPAGPVALPVRPSPPSSVLAAQRSDLVADLAAQVFIAHAAPGGKTEAFARKLAESGKPLLKLDSPAN